MSRIINKKNYINKQSNSSINFVSTQWERFLTIEGERAYNIVGS